MRRGVPFCFHYRDRQLQSTALITLAVALVLWATAQAFHTFGSAAFGTPSARRLEGLNLSYTSHNPKDDEALQAICERRLGKKVASPAAKSSYRNQYFAMVLVVKDTHEDLREWVAHHKAVGAGTIYLYDTSSDPPLKDVLKDHIESKFVIYHFWTPEFGSEEDLRHPQLEIWNDAIKSYRNRHQFLGFMDVDEFLIPNSGFNSVPEVLQHMQAFEPIGGLVVSWVMFGSSGHKTRPKGGVLQAYTKCMPLNNQHGIHVKSIVNTDFVDAPVGPHHFEYIGGKYAVTEHFQRVDDATVANVTGAPTVDYLGNYHYFTKSLEEWRAKEKRGSAMGNHKGFEYFEDVDSESTLDCLAATKYVYV